MWCKKGDGMVNFFSQTVVLIIILFAKLIRISVLIL